MSGDIGFDEDKIRYAVGKLDGASGNLDQARTSSLFSILSGVSVPATEAFHQALTAAATTSADLMSLSQKQLGESAEQVHATVNDLAIVDASIADDLAALNERAANVVLPTSDATAASSPAPTPPSTTSPAGVPPEGAQW
jgi:hypothetical protein